MTPDVINKLKLENQHRWDSIMRLAHADPGRSQETQSRADSTILNLAKQAAVIEVRLERFKGLEGLVRRD